MAQKSKTADRIAMKSAYVLLLACCLLAVGLAKPAAPLLNYQDTYGQYSFGYSGPTSARSEIRTLDGVTHGTYSYIDDAGEIQTTRYIADALGFRVISTNILPKITYLKHAANLVDLKAEKVDPVKETEKQALVSIYDFLPEIPRQLILVQTSAGSSQNSPAPTTLSESIATKSQEKAATTVAPVTEPPKS